MCGAEQMENDYKINYNIDTSSGLSDIHSFSTGTHIGQNSIAQISDLLPLKTLKLVKRVSLRSF